MRIFASVFNRKKSKERMIYIANPIYDVVFKYLMADERIARTILSALLQTDIVSLEVRPHEYPNSQRDALSVFRIDFAATIREADGSTHLALIELQKTWLETETLRFRQYLGVQYQNPKNMDREGYGMPMIAVYLLGHRVGDIDEPVLYVRHEARNREGQIVTKGLPDPFVSSLTHDSVIVQIPLLRGQVNTRLDRVLSIFDQTLKSDKDQHTLIIDDGLYAGDEDMQAVLHRLLMAAANADMRQDMNVEDEYFSAIEKRDTEILMREKQLAKQKVMIDEQKEEIEKKKEEIEKKKEEIEKKKEEIEKKKEEIGKKNAQLRSSIQALHHKGLSIEEISSVVNMDEKDIIRLLE